MNETDANSNAVIPIGDGIQDKLANTNLTKATCVYDPKIESVIVGLPNGTFVFNTRLRAWTEWTMGMSNSIRMQSSSDQNKVLFTTTAEGYVYENWIGEYDKDTVTSGTIIDFEMETKIFDGNEFAEFKKFRSMKFCCDTNTLSPFTATFKANDGDYLLEKDITIKKNVGLWDKAKWGIDKWAGGTLSICTGILNDKCTGNFFSIKINASHQYPLTIYKIAAEETTKERRREQ